MKYFDLLKEWQRLRFKVKDNIDQECEIRELCATPKKIISNGMGGGINVPPQQRYVEQIEDLLAKRTILMKNMKMARELLIDGLAKEVDDYSTKVVMQMVMFRNTNQPNWQNIASRICYSISGAKRLFEIGHAIMEAVNIQYTPIE